MLENEMELPAVKIHALDIDAIQFRRQDRAR